LLLCSRIAIRELFAVFVGVCSSRSVAPGLEFVNAYGVVLSFYPLSETEKDEYL